MKQRRLTLALVLALIAVLGAWPAQGGETFARYVPEGPVLYSTTQNLESVWDSIEGSNFWEKFTGLAIWEGADFGWYEEFQDEFAESLGFEFSTENVMALLGKEFAAAVYAEGGETLAVEVIFVVRMNPPEAVEEMVGKILAVAKEEGGDDVVITAVEHQGTKVQTIRAKDDDPPIQLRWAMQGDVFIVGIGNVAPRIEQCLDCIAGEGKPLAAAPQFAELIGMARQDRGSFFGEGYFSLARALEVVGGLGGGEAELEPLVNMLQMMTGATETLACTTHLDRGLRIKLAMVPGETMKEMWELMRSAAPSAGTHMKYIRPDTLMYVGVNSMPELGKLWPHQLKMYEKVGLDVLITDVIEQIELALGIDFQGDFLDILGTELAFVLEGLDMEGPFPFPKINLLVQVKDKEKGQALIDKIVGVIEENIPPELGITLTDVEHQGATFKVVGIPAELTMVELSPAMGLTENFLVISSGVEYAKAMVDTAKAGSSLAADPLYRSLGIPEETNSVFFINLTEGLKVGRKVAQWVVAMAEMQGFGDEMKERVDTDVLPLLDCLSVFKALAAYGVVSPEGATGMYIFRVEDLPAD